MKKSVLAAVILILISGCGGSEDSVAPSSQSTSELNGLWDAVEIDTNSNSVIVIKGSDFSFDSQFGFESYQGQVQTTIVGNIHKLNVKVTQTSEPQFMGKTSLCIYNLNSEATQSTLACNPPGHGAYPTDYVATNLTRVFTLTKRSSVVTPARLLGNWTSECSAGNIVLFNFISNVQLSLTVQGYANSDCSGGIILDQFVSGTYSIGNAIAVTDNSGASLTAYEFDIVNFQSPSTTVYNIAYIDDYGDFYYGMMTQTLDGSTPELRPNVILLDTSFHQIP